MVSVHKYAHKYAGIKKREGICRIYSAHKITNTRNCNGKIDEMHKREPKRAILGTRTLNAIARQHTLVA